jgi:hypothetical protein
MHVRIAIAPTMALVVAGLLIAPAALAQTDPGSRTTWSIQPATDGASDGRVSLRHTVDPGATVSDSLVLINSSATATSFRVYARDGLVTEAGAFDILSFPTLPRDGGSWVSFPSAPADAAPTDGLVVEVPAESTVAVPVAVSVPGDATPGDHPAGIVAELMPTDAGAVQLAARVGVRVHLRVSGDLAPALSARTTTVAYEPSWSLFDPGTLVLAVELANTGNVRLGAQLAASASGPFGLSPVDDEAAVREVLPGETTTLTTELPAWPWFLLVGQAVVTPAAVGDDEAQPAGDVRRLDFQAFTPPVAALVTAATIALLVSALVILQRRRRARFELRVREAVASARNLDVTPTLPTD